MKVSIRHRICAIVLLMVMMMQMGIRFAHQFQHEHEMSARTECADCQHHKVHNGHIFAWDDNDCCCFICQAFDSPYLLPDDVRCTAMTVEHHQACAEYLADAQDCSQRAASLRGPPGCLL